MLSDSHVSTYLATTWSLLNPSAIKNSAPVTSHGMYFPSTSLPSLPSLLLSEKPGNCEIVLTWLTQVYQEEEEEE